MSATKHKVCTFVPGVSSCKNENNIEGGKLSHNVTRFPKNCHHANCPHKRGRDGHKRRRRDHDGHNGYDSDDDYYDYPSRGHHRRGWLSEQLPSAYELLLIDEYLDRREDSLEQMESKKM